MNELITEERFMKINPGLKNYQLKQLTMILNGEQVVVSDQDLDTYNALEINGDLAVDGLVSIPNPMQCGILDRWIAYIVPHKLEEVQKRLSQSQE
jgi:hypothetical protein